MKRRKRETVSPRVLVQMLRIHMWADVTDDDSRWYCEQAAAVIEQLADRNLHLAKQLEHAEART